METAAIEHKPLVSKLEAEHRRCLRSVGARLRRSQFTEAWQLWTAHMRAHQQQTTLGNLERMVELQPSRVEQLAIAANTATVQRMQAKQAVVLEEPRRSITHARRMLRPSTPQQCHSWRRRISKSWWKHRRRPQQHALQPLKSWPRLRRN